MKKEDTKRVTKKSTREFLDKETGEMLEHETNTEYVVPREPDYVKLYLNDLGILNNVSNSALLWVLIRKMNYDGEVFFVGNQTKKICAELGIKDSGFWKQIKKMVDAEILIKQSRGVYMFNPYLIAKGKWVDIERIRMTVEYSNEGRVIKTDFKPVDKPLNAST